MPGDTLITTIAGDSVRMPDTLLQGQHTPAIPAYDDYAPISNAWVFWVGVSLVVLIFLLRPFIWGLIKRNQYKKLHEEAVEAVTENYEHYDTLLANYNSYYRSLSPLLRQRFLQRVTEFRETKEFKYIDIAPDDKMLLLISAAAIQLSFGLDKYLLEYFDTIYILQHDYRYGTYNVPFMGHVSNNGIYLSWDNFLRGYSDDTDGDNVGVHEMAHALAYVNFTVESSDDEDDDFKNQFKEFSKVARPIFNSMQNGVTNFLGSYAATNYNEFWAVAVENFFEKSLQMSIELPELYKAMCTLLRQDPMLTDKGIYPSL
jgi:MtfA peptidase